MSTLYSKKVSSTKYTMSDPFTLKHFSNVFNTAMFPQASGSSCEPIGYRDEKIVLKRLVRRKRQRITEEPDEIPLSKRPKPTYDTTGLQSICAPLTDLSVLTPHFICLQTPFHEDSTKICSFCFNKLDTLSNKCEHLSACANCKLRSSTDIDCPLCALSQSLKDPIVHEDTPIVKCVSTE